MDPVGKRVRRSVSLLTPDCRLEGRTQATRQQAPSQVCSPFNLPQTRCAGQARGCPGVGGSHLARHAASSFKSGGRGPCWPEPFPWGLCHRADTRWHSQACAAHHVTAAGQPCGRPDWRARPLPRTARPSSASWAKERKVSSLPVRVGPGARLSPQLAPASGLSR